MPALGNGSASLGCRWLPVAARGPGLLVATGGSAVHGGSTWRVRVVGPRGWEGLCNGCNVRDGRDGPHLELVRQALLLEEGRQLLKLARELL